MKIYRKLALDRNIIYLQLLHNNRLALVTEDKVFSILDLETMEKEHDFTFHNADVHHEKKSISFSPDGKYLAYSEMNQSVVRVINIHSHKLHHSFPTLQNKIETLEFDPSSSYLIAGSLTGRVYLWNLFSTGQVSRLSSFPEYSPHLLTQPKVNYVSAACFSPSGDLVATTGYGGSIVITNIHTEVSPKRITPNHVRINALNFINEDMLVSGNIEGALDIINLHNSQIHKHYQTGLGSISSIMVSSSGDFLLVSGHTKDILLIDLKKEKIREAAYISCPTKTYQLRITQDNKLIVACEEGILIIYELYPQDIFLAYINENAYDRAYELVQDYPLLEDSSLLSTIEEEWEDTLRDALVKIENNKEEEALLLLEKFSRVPSKVNLITQVKNFITHYPAFRSAASNENYSLAYSISEQTPLLKKSALFLRMEKVWDSYFLKAQTYVITNQKTELIKILEPFSRVNSKFCFIQVLLHQPSLFIEFINNVNAKDYEKIFAVTHSYPCLKEIKSYKELLHDAKDLVQACRQHIYTAKYNLAQDELEKLEHIPSMKQQTLELKHLFSLSTRLQELYENEDFLSCYTLIDKNEVLQTLPLAKKLEDAWNVQVQASEKEALLGNIKAIKEIFKELISLGTRSQKIGTLLRLGFLMQIKLLVIKKQIETLYPAIHNYIHFFGYDTELHNLILKLKQDDIVHIDLDEEQMHHRPRSLWLVITEGKIPDTILQYTKENV